MWSPHPSIRSREISTPFGDRAEVPFGWCGAAGRGALCSLDQPNLRGSRLSSDLELDWPDASVAYDALHEQLRDRDLSDENEAQTRFDVIDRLIREVLGWQHGQIDVEEPTDARRGFVDYVLRTGDRTIVIEAKRHGAAFPSPTRRSRLKVDGTVLTTGSIGAALRQVHQYALDKEADLAVVTNGRCWCYYAVQGYSEDSEAGLFFPFDRAEPDARQLYELLAQPAVRAGSLVDILRLLPRTEDRLLSVVRDADGRIDRNNIADHLIPALDHALYADALLSDIESLERCFVSTEARTKFDATLGMHFADVKPLAVEPARRIRKDQAKGELAEFVERSIPSYAPPVTLIIGPVGAGKSTYLKHFELVSGRDLLDRKRAHWVYVDLEPMGRGGDPRRFIYGALRDYLQADRPDDPTDYRTVVGPAYDDEIKGWARGPLAPVYGDKPEFNRRITDYISADFEAVEPYVDKVFRHLASKQLCVVVLDNVDLYEDDDLETKVFAEGLALSKRQPRLLAARDHAWDGARHDGRCSRALRVAVGGAAELPNGLAGYGPTSNPSAQPIDVALSTLASLPACSS